MSVVKSRLQLQRANNMYTGMRHAFVDIVKKEGMGALYRVSFFKQKIAAWVKTICDQSRSLLNLKLFRVSGWHCPNWVLHSSTLPSTKAHEICSRIKWASRAVQLCPLSLVSIFYFCFTTLVDFEILLILFSISTSLGDILNLVDANWLQENVRSLGILLGFIQWIIFQAGVN